ncbi:MAG: hypothetical protein ABIR26_02160 [Ramlibacter sp.]
MATSKTTFHQRLALLRKGSLMNTIKFVVAIFLSAVALMATAQTNEEAKKAAAREWLEKERFTLSFKRVGFSMEAVYVVSPTKKEISFGNAGNECGRGTLPAVLSEENGIVSVFVSRTRLPDCEDLKFIFDATTLVGEVQTINRKTQVASKFEVNLLVSPK